jgi:hypothetical protein
MILSVVLAILALEAATAADPYVRKLRNGKEFRSFPWPGGNVFYELPSGLFKKSSMQDWNKIFQNIEENTCINIKERKTEKFYIKIGRDNGEANRVENLGFNEKVEAQKLWILLDDPTRPGYTSAYYDTQKHEFLHSLGLDHDEFNLNIGGQAGPYDWERAYGVLRAMYKCQGKYPRVVSKRPGTSDCEDEQPDQCSQAITEKGREWACTGRNGAMAKKICAKSCDLCGDKQPDTCYDKASDCADSIKKNGFEWTCTNKQSWYSTMCDKLCKKC